MRTKLTPNMQATTVLSAKCHPKRRPISRSQLMDRHFGNLITDPIRE